MTVNTTNPKWSRALSKIIMNIMKSEVIDTKKTQ